MKENEKAVDLLREATTIHENLEKSLWYSKLQNQLTLEFFIVVLIVWKMTGTFLKGLQNSYPYFSAFCTLLKCRNKNGRISYYILKKTFNLLLSNIFLLLCGWCCRWIRLKILWSCRWCITCLISFLNTCWNLVVHTCAFAISCIYFIKPSTLLLAVRTRNFICTLVNSVLR